MISGTHSATGITHYQAVGFELGYSQALLVKLPTSKVHLSLKISCRLQNPIQHSERHKPTAVARVAFHFREPIKRGKKKASEQYNFYCLNYRLILKTVPKETFYKSEQHFSLHSFFFSLCFRSLLISLLAIPTYFVRIPC